ncbi:DUF1918 domain-containing protein [Pseudonocardia alni]|uniref:DUF1918 domain-containing protein n=1 Tax=Pseudonocardia alni TaxID=33907 RepID=UPI0033DA5B72
MLATTGDHIVVDSHQVSAARRHGVVLEVLYDGGEPHYRVHWDDGHESVFFPGPDARVEDRARER